jgi:hypothetical protein
MQSPDPHKIHIPGGPGDGDGGNSGIFDNSAIFDDGQFFLLTPQGDSRTSGHTGGSSSTTASATGSASTSPFVINISWDSSVSSAPTGFVTAVQNAVQFLESQFQDPVTITIDVGYGEVNGSSLGSGVLGESESYLTSVSYSTLVKELKANATTAADQSAVSTLPATSPVNGNYWESTAEAKALGLISSSAQPIDGYVGFSSTYSFTYNDSSGVSAGSYDFNGVALHEMSEVMGRMLLTGATIGGIANGYDALDLYHYSSPGTRDFSASTPGYLSINAGTTDNGNFNTVSGGDAGDWASSMGNDAFDAFSNSGVVNAFTSADLTAMNVLGWEPTASSGPPPPPTGVAVAAATQSLGALQAANGLAANGAIATVTQVGGGSGDSFTYTLGGANSASFALSTSNNVGTLSAGPSAVAGAPGGAVYALTLTATDTTYNESSPADPLDVVVGSSGSDTINVETLVGSATTPTFIYGLGGSDTLNGAGMTSKLWIDGGAGGQIMTGGAGVNDYLYAAAGDSAPSSMDDITNFHTAADLIDLTGLRSTLKYVGQISGSRLGAHSVGWQASGGNTFVYANTSSARETLGATNMQIELQGTMSLSSGNILHH